MIINRISIIGLNLLLALLMSSVLQATEPTRVACVGDSITFGAAIKDRENRNYPVQLGVLLGDGYDVRNY